MIYGINDRPPIKQLLLFSTQLMLYVFVATVLIAQICGVEVSGALVGAGLATLIYIICTKGKSPMFVSNSGAFVAPVMTALALGGHMAVVVGGITTFVVYGIFAIIFTKIPVENIYKVFPKALIGSVTVVIGINLMPFILTYVQINGSTNIWGIVIAFITMFSIAVISHYSNGILKILPFLVGTLIGYACAVILTITGIYPIVDFSVFNNLTLFSIPDFAFTHWADIPVNIIMPIVIIYTAYTVSAMMEALSDHAALGNIIGVDLYEKPGLSNIFMAEGFANLTGSIVGGLGICSYGEGVACVGFSKVASVWVTCGASIILILLGFIAPVQAFIASIPSCVFAGSACILYGFIACSGVKMLQSVDLNVQKNLVVTSAVLSLGISGLAIGNDAFSISATALALIVGVILNLILKESDINE
jgi:uracil permease